MLILSFRWDFWESDRWVHYTVDKAMADHFMTHWGRFKSEGGMWKIRRA
jgi:hypothetical protein